MVVNITFMKKNTFFVCIVAAFALICSSVSCTSSVEKKGNSADSVQTDNNKNEKQDFKDLEKKMEEMQSQDSLKK
jgi:hypothetical protein